MILCRLSFQYFHLNINSLEKLSPAELATYCDIFRKRSEVWAKTCWGKSNYVVHFSIYGNAKTHTEENQKQEDKWSSECPENRGYGKKGGGLRGVSESMDVLLPFLSSHFPSFFSSNFVFILCIYGTFYLLILLLKTILLSFLLETVDVLDEPPNYFSSVAFLHGK